MAAVQRPPRTEQITVEIFQVSLTESEAEELLADPEGFTQQLLGEDQLINAVHLSKEIADGSTCPDRELVHVITPGPTFSEHSWVCIHEQ